MFLISDDDVPKYKYTITVVGSDTDDYRVGMWNTCDEGHRPRSPRVTDVFPLEFTVPVGSRRSVAFDGGSHGGFVTYQSGSAIPHSAAGVVLGFWGEFVFAHESSGESSAFDVCAFEALRAGHAQFSGLRIDGRDEVSFIATNLTSQANAILSGDVATNHGCVLSSGPLSLVATVDYRG
ncbi:hypothetical protein PISL3812_09972 [Talaromyces islandicus]|uniref:Uncharacterized protein n=1 Tax=Talaromyces islandicus TaxID=28573 RepID=A0A0U1MD77_TALIS|nr:hypothetical protein PISL3812_09972 [Talaromyces islandicus]